jgi:hypothetical protein
MGTAPIPSYDSSSPLRHWRGWVVAAGLGVVVGLLLGAGINASYTHGKWPILAGILVGIVGALATRSHLVLVSLGAGAVVTFTSVAMVVIHQWRIGHWPIMDEFTIEHYGTATMAAMRLAVALLFLVCVPCLIAIAVATFVGRFSRLWRD